MSERQVILYELGFENYFAYLRSERWWGIRLRVFEQKGRLCLECKERRATQIHHQSYTPENLLGETLEGLIPICAHCHLVISKGDPSKKRKKKAERAANRRRKWPKRKGPSSGSYRLERVLCPRCRVNRKLAGGPCPPCRKALAKAAG